MKLHYFDKKTINDHLKNSKTKIQFDIKDINSKQDIFDKFINKLDFPDYFGNNWDAFADTLAYETNINSTGLDIFISVSIKINDNTLNKTFKDFIEVLDFVDNHKLENNNTIRIYVENKILVDTFSKIIDKSK